MLVIIVTQYLQLVVPNRIHGVAALLGDVEGMLIGALPVMAFER
jgi:hypothetical protein